MVHKYGIYQSSKKSCVFYKQDEDGNQSTFNIFIKPKTQEIDRNKIIAFIDSNEMEKEHWNEIDESNVKDVIEAFGGWASDAPVVFELEAHKSMSNCLSSMFKKEESENK